MNILHLEDSANDAELVEHMIRQEWPQAQIDRVGSREGFREALKRAGFDLILSDYTLEDFDGLEALDMAHVLCPDKPYVFISGTIGEERAIEALKRGASDYIIKDHPSRLVPAIKQALSLAEEVNRRRRSEKRFHDLFEFAPDAIVMTDSEGIITLINQKAEKLFGYGRTELVGQSVDKLMSASAKLGSGAFLRQFLADARQGNIGRGGSIYRAYKKGGAEFPVELSRGSMEFETGVGVVAAIRDVTERENAQRMMLRTQRMESIGTLAGGIAHDLNNALAPIVMGVGMLRLQYPDATSMIDSIEASAQRGADMVRQLMTFAKGLEGERLLLQTGQLIQDIKKITEGTFPKNIELKISLPNKLKLVLGDATQLHQVLLNLCVNARDAMPDGGILTLEAGNVEVDSTFASAVPEARVGEYVRIQVKDTGLGMAPEVLERIFEPFFSTKGPNKGTGLGLSTVLGIVNSHEGFIRVHSEAGKGSTFSVYLPVGSSSAVVTPAPAKLRKEFHGDGETILLVDDEAPVRQVARSVLTALNFKVLTASDGAEALGIVAQNRAVLRVVITDSQMPHMDGLNFVRILKYMLPGAPIIVTSGGVNEREADEYKKLEISAFLEKPFTQEKLVEALGLALKAMSSPGTRWSGSATSPGS